MHSQTPRHVFFGQAVGMGEHAVLGLVLQRAIFLACVIAAAPLAAWTQAGPLLQMLGQKVGD